MTEQDLEQVQLLLKSPEDIVIVPHKNPDGDAIGSTLALSTYLKKKGHRATVIAPNDYPEFLKWMPGTAQVLVYQNEVGKAQEVIANATLIFTLDFNHFSRTGEMEKLLKNTQVPFIMIDHHQEPASYATVTYSDVTMSSTCEMVYHFITRLGDGDLIDADIASCLYTGIMTDTGSFRFASTTPTTHRVAADLIEKGAIHSTIHQRIYDTNSYSRMQLLGVALNNLKVLDLYRTAYITLTQQELDDHNFKKGDTEGFVNYGLSLQGVRFAVIFIENTQESIIKISFRSIGDFSVNAFARAHFSGGGHDNAAGGKSDLSLTDTVRQFKSLLPQYEKELNS